MLQYPKSVHVTLPSVESWGINNNIIKDPPKAIFTRKIDKVGDNNDLLNMVDESGDRVCEGINVYARGINPFTAVEYSNASNNAGIKGNPTSYSNQAQAKLPYRVLLDGEFRPPVQNPRDLLPLSRQPRLLTSALANPEFIDFSKKRHCPEKFREIKKEVVQTSVRPTAVYALEKPIEPFNLGNGIKEHIINVSANAGFNVRGDRTNQEFIRPIKGANNESNNVYANTNYGSNVTVRGVDNINVDTTKYIQDVNYHDMISNPSKNIQVKSLKEMTSLDENQYLKDNTIYFNDYQTNVKGFEQNQDFVIDEDRFIKDVEYTNYRTNIKGTEIDNLITDEIHLDRVMPAYQSNTNMSDSRIYKAIEAENEYHFERNTPLTQANTNKTQNYQFNNNATQFNRLPQSLQKGGFDPKPTMPQVNRTYEGESLNDQRKKFNDKVNSYMEGRYQVGKIFT